MTDLGHNNPPGMIEAAGATTSQINHWLSEHPVIETEEQARLGKLFADRGKLCGKDLDDERDKLVRPLNETVKAINDKYRPAKDTLGKITQEVLRRLTDYLAKEEAKRIKIAEETRKKAEEAEQAARAAEERERDALSDADDGVVVDVAEANREADTAFAEFRRASREALLAERQAKVKVGGGFTRSLSLRNKETLTVIGAGVAIAAIGLTPDIEAAIIKGARAYRALNNELPPGIESKIERTA